MRSCHRQGEDSGDSGDRGKEVNHCRPTWASDRVPVRQQERATRHRAAMRHTASPRVGTHPEPPSNSIPVLQVLCCASCSTISRAAFMPIEAAAPDHSRADHRPPQRRPVPAARPHPRARPVPPRTPPATACAPRPWSWLTTRMPPRSPPCAAPWRPATCRATSRGALGRGAGVRRLAPAPPARAGGRGAGSSRGGGAEARSRARPAVLLHADPLPRPARPRLAPGRRGAGGAAPRPGGPPSPAQLRRVADLIEQGHAAAHRRRDRRRAHERKPAPARTNRTLRPPTDEPAPVVGTNEPTAAADRTNDLHLGTDEPKHPVPPLPETRTDEPDDLPARPPLNRHQRRRLAALARCGLRRAA